jgi:FkbM family methyltransferase
VGLGKCKMENLVTMTIQDFLGLRFNSPFLRKVLSFRYKENQFYKVQFGMIKGSQLYYRKDINFHAIAGLWEKDSLSLLNDIFSRFGLNQKGVTVADVGANIGYYSIFFSKYLDPSTEIFAFEPSSSILPVLRKNIDVNQIKNVKILDLACSDHTGDDEFFIGEHHHQSSLVSEWAGNNVTGTKTVVSVTTLDHFFEKYNNGRYPDLIKMDIEGGGKYALKGCDKCITEKRPLILIESHTPEEDNAICDLLANYKYEAFRVNTGKWVKNKENNYHDTEGVWGTMFLIPQERRAKANL